MIWEILKCVQSVRTVRRLAMLSREFRRIISVIPQQEIEALFLKSALKKFAPHSIARAALSCERGEEEEEEEEEEEATCVEGWTRVKDATVQRRSCVHAVCTILGSTTSQTSVSEYTRCLLALEYSLDEDSMIDILSSSGNPLSKLCALHALARCPEVRLPFGDCYPLRKIAKDAYVSSTNHSIELVFYERGILDSTTLFRARDQLRRHSIFLDQVVYELGLQKDQLDNTTVQALKLLDSKCWAHRISGLREPKLSVIGGDQATCFDNHHRGGFVHWAHRPSSSP